MNIYQINPIDMMPFIGVPQNPDAQKKKLLSLYQHDLQTLLDSGQTEAYNELLEKIKAVM